MILTKIDMRYYNNELLIDKVRSAGNHHLSCTGDCGFYYYRRRPYFYVRKKGSCVDFYWFTIIKASHERYPLCENIFKWFMSYSHVSNLINELKK